MSDASEEESLLSREQKTPIQLKAKVEGWLAGTSEGTNPEPVRATTETRRVDEVDKVLSLVEEAPTEVSRVSSSASRSSRASSRKSSATVKAALASLRVQQAKEKFKQEEAHQLEKERREEELWSEERRREEELLT